MGEKCYPVLSISWERAFLFLSSYIFRIIGPFIFFNPHGMHFIHATCDLTLMNSPITKLFCYSDDCKEKESHHSRFLRYFDFAQYDKNEHFLL